MHKQDFKNFKTTVQLNHDEGKTTPISFLMKVDDCNKRAQDYMPQNERYVKPHLKTI